MTLRLVRSQPAPRQAIVPCPNCAKAVTIGVSEKKHACKWCGNVWSQDAMPKILRTGT